MRKKLLLFLMAVVLSLPSFARDFQYEYKGQTITYTVIDEETKTVKTKNGGYDRYSLRYSAGNKVSGDLELPANPKDGDVEYSLTEIGAYAFYGCSNVTSVIIPNSVQTIGERAFDGCSGLVKSAYPNTISDPFEDGLRVDYNPEGVIIEDGVIYGPDKTEIRFAPCTLKGEYSIPETVTSISKWAFSVCKGLTSVIIPNSVQTIGESAFRLCGRLTSVIIGNSVQTIGRSAFQGCSGLVKSAYPSTISNPFGDGIQVAYNPEGAIIEDGFIYGPDKSSILFVPITFEGAYTIPETVTSIGEYAFYACSRLTSVNALSVTPPVMYESSFKNLYGTVKLEVPESAVDDYLATNWSLFENLYRSGSDKAIGTYSDGVLNYRLIPALNSDEKNVAFITSGKYSGEIAVPERFTDDSDAANPIRYYIEGIGYKAFYGSNISKIEFNSRINLKYIGDDAFNGCTGIEEIIIPETVETIGKYAFYGCSGIKEIIIPETVETIGGSAFSGCSGVRKIVIPETVETIGEYAFAQCTALTQISLPDNITEISDGTFYNCYNLIDIKLGDKLESIGEKAFANETDRNKVNQLVIPSTLRFVGNDAFYKKSISTVKITDLRAWCDIDFSNTNSNPAGHALDGVWVNDEELVNLIIPEGVTEIKPYAFQIHEIKDDKASTNSMSVFKGRLKSVLIPGSVTSIGKEVFLMNGFTEIIIPGSVEYIGNKAFSSANGIVTLENYSHTFTINPLKQLTLQDGTTPIVIEQDAFSADGRRYEILTDNCIPDNVYLGRQIENLPNGFKTKVKTLEIGDQVTEICEGLWEGAKLEKLRVGNAVESIGNTAFKGCGNLSNLTLGSSLKTIGDESFQGCGKLGEVIVPPSVETIGASAFAGNSNLASIIMGHSVKTIGEKAFDGCAAKTVSITAQTPPTAPNNTFSSYSGSLYLQGKGAVDAYYDAYTCWDRFNSYVMIEATGIETNMNTISGKAGDTFQLTATLMPDNVTLPQFFWRSTNPEIATVDENGLVTLHADLSSVLSRAGEGEDCYCKIIAESLYANGPVVEVSVYNSGNTGVEEILEDTVSSDIDFSAPVEVYNLSGIKVGTTTSGLAKGLYIVRQGKLAKKIAVK